MVWIENSYVKSGGAWRSGPGFRLIMTMPRLMASLSGVTTYKNIIIIIVEHNSHDGWSWPGVTTCRNSIIMVDHKQPWCWSWFMTGVCFPFLEISTCMHIITHHHDPEVISSSLIILSGLVICSFALSLFALSLYSLFTKWATRAIQSLKKANCTFALKKCAIRTITKERIPNPS